MDSEELKYLAPVIEALRRMANDPSTYRKSLDQVDQQFLEEIELQCQYRDTGARDAMTATEPTAPIVLHRPESVGEAWDRVRKIFQLSAKDLKVLCDLGVIRKGPDEKPKSHIKQLVVLSPMAAKTYLSALILLACVAVAGLLSSPAQGLWQWSQAASLGYALGAVAGLVLGHSFRIYHLVDSLKSIDAWLSFEDRAAHA